MEHIITTRQGVRLCWEGFGDPGTPPLLLIAGHSAQAVWWRAEFIQLLVDKGYYVIRYDNRDVGRSQHFAGAAYTIEDMADDAAGLLDGLGIPSAHVVGQSMGGMIAQELALRHPHTVLSLTLMFTLGRLPDSMLEAGPRVPAPTAGSREEAIEQFVLNEQHCRSRDYPQDVEWLRALGGEYYDRGYDPAGLDRQMDAVMRQRDRLPALAGLDIPTAVLAGSTDQLIEPSASRDLAQAIPGATLRIFEGMGHELPVPLWTEITGIIDRTAERATAPQDEPV
jgi:pimeloyl-ACP methyl ester carboxylesterase